MTGKFVAVRKADALIRQLPPPYEREVRLYTSPRTHAIEGHAVGMSVIPPGQASSAHVHDNEQEIWFVVSGRGEAEIGGEKVALEPEMLVTIKPGNEHPVKNTGDEELKILFFYVPAGPEGQILDDTFR